MKTPVQNQQIVLVGDDYEAYDLVSAYFKPKGYSVKYFATPQIAVQAAETEGSFWNVLITDFNKSEIQFFLEIKRLLPSLPIIHIIPPLNIGLVSDNVRSGFADFVVEPIHFAQLQVAVERAFYIRPDSMNKTQKVSQMKSASQSKIIGVSPQFLSALEISQRVAASTANIFITGESGTGKEVFARYIHSEGQNPNGPFVAINCSAIPENLLESELFGHAKGSFTGAIDKKVGLFEEAQDGTLFLDEIGDLSLSLQAKLLRVLQDKQIKRVGENHYRSVNCRIISATHKNLSTEINDAKFREDLFFRLNVIPIAIPPLRERQEDIIPLAEFFMKKYVRENNSSVITFSDDALEFIRNNSWRGNVRELENSIERAVVLCTETEICLQDFLPFESRLTCKVSPHDVVDFDTGGFNIPVTEELPTLNYIINKYIEYAVGKNEGARDKTAKDIGIDRKTLYKRMKTYDLLTPQLNLLT